MEEVWGNISSSSLPCVHNPKRAGKSPNFHDFFNMRDPYLDEALHPSAPLSSLKPRNNLVYHCVQTPTIQMGSVSKKRPSSPINHDDSAGERRRKRLIKNRESADRSRARRLAYTNELEQEMEDLKKENASLKAQLQEVQPRAHLEKVPTSSTAGANNQQLHSTKGNSLCRTLTAPF